MVYTQTPIIEPCLCCSGPASLHVEAPPSNTNFGGGKAFSRKFAIVIILFELVLGILYGTCADYATQPAESTSNTVLQHYGKFQDVHVMIFIGFGFLMTFLKK